MPHDRPTAAELVDAVAEFLERDLQPALEGRLAFHTRVAVNALRLVERELALGPQLDARRRDGLASLLAPDATGTEAPVRDREVELARRIRDGSLDAVRPDVVAYLRATLRVQLDIVHPGYIRQEHPGP